MKKLITLLALGAVTLYAYKNNGLSIETKIVAITILAEARGEGGRVKTRTHKNSSSKGREGWKNKTHQPPQAAEAASSSETNSTDF